MDKLAVEEMVNYVYYVFFGLIYFVLVSVPLIGLCPVTACLD